MPYRLAADEGIDAGLRRILFEEIAKVRRALADEAKSAERRVFKARKRLKRARSVVRLLKVPLGTKTRIRLAASLRDVGRALSPARDADMLVKSARALALAAGPEETGLFDPLIVNLQTRADAVRSRLSADFEWSRSAMRAAEADAQRLPVTFPAETLLDKAFARVYERGRAYRQIAMRTGRAEAFHDWRKFTKQRWHLSLLVRDRAGPDFGETIAGLAALGKLLGADHDLAVLEETCRRRPALAGAVKVRRTVRDAIRDEQSRIRARALDLAKDLYIARTDAALTSFQSAYDSDTGDMDRAVTRKIPAASAAE